VSHHQAPSRALLHCGRLTLAIALLGCVLAGPASAAAPTPESATSCGGRLTRATPSTNDPNLINYTFNCDWGVSSYTLIVNRGLNDDTTLDDFSSSAGVFDASGNPDSTESFSCSGTIPGNGVNCNAGAGGLLPAPEFAQGSFNTSDPYCANIPVGSPAGTRPEPTALVELVVTDTTGAQDGPFRLRLHGSCPAVHVVKVKVKPKTKKHQSGKGAKKTVGAKS
jgi:hypothetical protein